MPGMVNRWFGSRFAMTVRKTGVHLQKSSAGGRRFYEECMDDAFFRMTDGRELDVGSDAHEFERDALGHADKGTVVAGLVEQLSAELADELLRHDVGILHTDAEMVETAGGAIGHGSVGGDLLEEDLHAGERDNGAVGSAELAEANEAGAEGFGPEADHGVEVGAAEMNVVKGNHGYSFA